MGSSAVVTVAVVVLVVVVAVVVIVVVVVVVVVQITSEPSVRPCRNPKHPSPSVGRWAPSSASETMAGSARLQSLPTTPLRGRQAWSPSHCISIY